MGQDQLFRKRALDRLSSPEELDQLMQVTTPRGWMALVGLIGFLVVVIVIGVRGTIPVLTEGAYCVLTQDDSSTVSAVVYVQQNEQTPILSGAEARLTPTVRTSDRNQFMIGEVISVGVLPVSPQEMLDVLDNQALVNRLLQDVTLYEARVRLTPVEREGEPAVYEWSSGVPLTLGATNKLPCNSVIVVANRTPAELILRNFQ